MLHDEDLAYAIVDRVLERGRLLTLDGPSLRTKHLGLDDPTASGPSPQVARISGIRAAEFPEPTSDKIKSCGRCVAVSESAVGHWLVVKLRPWEAPQMKTAPRMLNSRSLASGCTNAPGIVPHSRWPQGEIINGSDDPGEDRQ